MPSGKSKYSPALSIRKALPKGDWAMRLVVIRHCNTKSRIKFFISVTFRSPALRASGECGGYSRKCVSTLSSAAESSGGRRPEEDSAALAFQSVPDGNLSGNSLRNALAISGQHRTFRFQLRVLCLRVKYSCFSKACSLMKAPFVLVVLRRQR